MIDSKLKKIIIRNFRGIWPEWVEITLDDIVVLVWPNNSGKSTVLKALKKISDNNLSLCIDDFYNKDVTSKIEIETHTWIADPSTHNVNDTWVNSDKIVIEKWFVNETHDSLIRVGYNVKKWDWANVWDSPQAPFASDAASQQFRLLPTYISAFESPEEQSKEISKLISNQINDKIRADFKEKPETDSIAKSIKSLYDAMKEQADKESEVFSLEIKDVLSKIFTNTKVCIMTNFSNPDFIWSFWKAGDISLNINDVELSHQWGWMQRTLVLAILKLLSEKTEPKKKTWTIKKKTAEEESTTQIERGKILLFDEPEICLHPDSIRQAKEVLYNLWMSEKWQIMVTTHSPVFIDLTEDNTTIIRVDKSSKEGTVKLYRPQDSSLSTDDKEALKMLNICDPHVAEFFFSSRVIVVEWDTEYTAFNTIISSDKEKYRDIHIVRARWKFTIIPLIKILSKWWVRFSILHDSDTPMTEKGKVNSAWTANEKILSTISETWSNCRLIASKLNFESAFFHSEVKSDKPFNAYQKMETPEICHNVSVLLDYLAYLGETLPVSWVLAYKTIDDLEKFINI